MNFAIVRYLIGWLMGIESLFLLLPAFTAVIYREPELPAYIATALICMVGAGILCEYKPKNTKFYAREGFVAVALCWLVLAVTGALPFVLSREIPSAVDAIFEAASGFTTTGATILGDVEALSHASMLWRCLMHWVGGMGILVFMLIVLPLAGGQTIYLMRVESPGPSVSKISPHMRDTALILYAIYFGLTVLQIILLLFGGMPMFDAICVSLGTAGTGGFGIKADSIASYSAYLQWVITVFMLLFGVSFNIYCLMLVRRWREALRSNELRCYLGIFAAATVIVCINIYPMYGSVSDVIRLSSFQTASIITTTGYATADFNTWPQLSKAVLFILMFCGGCMGSTAGGLKISRVTVLAQVCANELRRSINPRSVNSVKLNGSVLTSEQEQRVLSYLALYIAVIAVTFILISVNGLGFEENISAVVSCVNNIGPGFGLIGPAGSYATYSGFAKIVLSVAMLIGRLEIYPLLALTMIGSKR